MAAGEISPTAGEIAAGQVPEETRGNGVIDVALGETCDLAEANPKYWCNSTCDATPPPCHEVGQCPMDWIRVSGGSIEGRPEVIGSFWIMKKELLNSEYAVCNRANPLCTPLSNCILPLPVQTSLWLVLQ